LLGSPKDKAICDVITEQSEGVINFAGKTTLEDAMALMTLSQVVISNDSGLMHIAAACQKPVVAIYGSTTPVFTPPLSSQAHCVVVNDLPCAPCFKRTCSLTGEDNMQCMKRLSPEIVLTQLNELIDAYIDH
jgi:heptosyltransferase-2